MLDQIKNPTVPKSLQKDFRIAIVAASWHKEIVSSLITGARQTAIDCGMLEDHVTLFRVAGTYELPQMVEVLAATKKYDGIVPVGCVIKGETNHFELICDTIAKSFDKIGRKNHVAVSFGVVSAYTIEQAVARAGGDKGNKGSEAMAAAIALALQVRSVL
ncbi:MAG: 6,7-dimethyl-8-ribityllumazine synthase [Bdellovibrionota bacterium]|nr:6,7-dimethyl-8-ribityllumazine synthase [Deltaproteobacteria bacterium]